MTASGFLTAIELYAWAGLATSTAFLIWGAPRLDSSMKGALVFRFLLIPGIVILWPLILWRWMVLEKGWDEAKRHRPPHRIQSVLAMILVVGLPAVMALAFYQKQDRNGTYPAVQISAPDGAGTPANTPASTPANTPANTTQ